MSLKFSFENSVFRVQYFLQTRGQTIKQALIDKMFYMMQKLEEKIVTEKLSAEYTDDDSLRTVTGRLALSIQAMPVKVKGDTITGQVMQNPRNAPYGIYHLKGGTRVYRIPSAETAMNSKTKALHFWWKEREWFLARVQRKPLKKRDFMTAAFLEMQPEINRELRRAVIDALQPDFQGY